MSPLETRKVLLLSTGHLTAKCCEGLDCLPLSLWPVTGGNLPHGFYIYAHDEDRDGKITEFAPELWACLQFARAQGFDYIQFDCDVDLIVELEAFDHG